MTTRGLIAMARWWAYVDMESHPEDECWRWVGPMGKFGYGYFTADGRRTVAHRFGYEALVDPVPVELDLDHLCRRRECVNPAHLEPVTRQENIRRGESHAGQNARKTHCKYGHPFDEENTRFNRNGSRTCKACAHLNYERRKAAS